MLVSQDIKTSKWTWI